MPKSIFMKNSRVFATAFALFLCVVLVQCTPDTSGITPATEDVLIRKSWTVDYYYHNQDMTNTFVSSKILFSSTGSVGYLKDGVTIPGTWSKGVDASHNELIMLQFNTSDANIIQLNKSWRLTDRTINSFQFVENDGTTNILFRIKAQ